MPTPFVSIKSVSSGGYLDGRSPGSTELYLTLRAVDAYLEWMIVPTGDGYVALHSVSGGRYIDGRGPDSIGGANLLLTDRPPIGDGYLNWQVVVNPNKTLSFLSRSSGAYLDGRYPPQNNQGNQVFLSQGDPSTNSCLQWIVSPADSSDSEALRDILTSATQDSLMACCTLCNAEHSECRPLCVKNLVDEVQASAIQAQLYGGIVALAVPQPPAPAKPEQPPIVPGARSDAPSGQDPANRNVLCAELPPLHAMAVGAVSTTAVPNYAWVGLKGNGYVSIHWTGPAQSYDWIGLYSSSSKGVNEYLTYQWATSGDHYDTSEYFVSGLSARYYRWNSDLGRYTELFRTSDLNLDVEVGVGDERLLTRGCWVSSTSKANTQLNWVFKPNSNSYDWVGLFAADASVNQYVQWQWACRGNSYDTGDGMYAGYHARYYTYDARSGQYVCLRYSKPFGGQYLDLSSIYPGSQFHQLAVTDGVPKIVSIAYDQFMKAFRQEPSIFSLGIWPLGAENLLWKNLSRQEVAIIVSDLLPTPSRVLDCLMVYYGTYQLAIQIADDSERNAKRHVYWQVEMCRKFGKDFAKRLGDAHEAGRPGSTLDNQIDDANNAAALAYCLNNPTVDGATAANILWSNGQLQGYDSPTQVVVNSPRPATGPQRAKDEL